jgi:RNHCP domain
MSRRPFNRPFNGKHRESLEGEREHPPRRRDARQTRRQAGRAGDRRSGGTRRTRLPPEAAPVRHPQRGRGHTPDDSFTCGHCHRFIGPLPSGGRHRNHCPFCLYSRHVDATRSGDRASACRALMAPIGAFQRPNGEHVIVHRCLGCGFERFNRVAADDDFDLVLALPVLPARSARREGRELTTEGTEDTEY